MFYKIKPVPKENALNAVCYYRYSSTNQTDNSIDGQRRECRKYANKHGFKIIEEYIDKAASGTNDNREAFQKMIEDAKKQMFAFILVYRFDRFARNRYDSAIYKKQLEQYGVKVISVTENVGTGDEGLILESIYEAMDEAYSRRLSRITQRGMREIALKGLWTGGHAPFGFQVKDKKLVICDKEAQAIKYAANEILNGIGTKYICDELYNRGCRARNGKKITTSTLRVILSNPAIMGKRKYQDLEIECPSILSEEEFERINLRLSSTKKKVGKHPDTEYFMLSGKLFCGECGAAMTGDSGTSRNGEKHYYYTCAERKSKRSCKKKSEKKDFIEWYICEQTVLNVLTDENIKKIAKLVIAKQEEDKHTFERKTIESQLQEIDKKFDKLADAFINTPTPAFAKKIENQCKDLEEQKEALTARLNELKLTEEIRLTVKDVEGYLKSFTKGDLLDKSFRYRLIKALINCVYLYDDKIVIYFNLRDSKSIHYIDVINDLDQLSTDTSDVFDEFKPRGANTLISRTHYFISVNGVFGIVIIRS